MNSKKWIVAILLMMFFSWCSFRGYDIKFFQNTKPLIKHSINFGLLVGTALAGTVGLTSFSKIWVRQVWIFIYIAVIIFFICAGLTDLFFRINRYNIREMISNMRMLFTSPLPFVLLSYMGRVKKKEDDKPVL